MAIIDKNLVVVDAPLRENGTSRAVPLTGLTLAGRMQAMPLRMSVTEAYEANVVQKLTITMQQAPSPAADGDVPAAPAEGDPSW